MFNEVYTQANKTIKDIFNKTIKDIFNKTIKDIFNKTIKDMFNFLGFYTIVTSSQNGSEYILKVSE